MLALFYVYTIRSSTFTYKKIKGNATTALPFFHGYTRL